MGVLKKVALLSGLITVTGVLGMTAYSTNDYEVRNEIIVETIPQIDTTQDEDTKVYDTTEKIITETNLIEGDYIEIEKAIVESKEVTETIDIIEESTEINALENEDNAVIVDAEPYMFTGYECSEQDEPEDIIEVEQNTSEEEIEEHIVYKPSTHYVHRSTCHWVDSECYEINNTEGIEARVCTECNPDIYIEIEYEEPMEQVDFDKVSIGNFKITGYVASGSQTASGTWPSSGRTVAMNNSQRKSLSISYGDQIYIDGFGTYTVEDSGCSWGVIDIFCNSVQECYNITTYADAYTLN